MDPVIVPRNMHIISRQNIDRDALKVLYRLLNHGYLAYLVGGSVRDLLLNRRPKDFDVVTDARPQAIRSLFRNAFLIGRRFRLVHIRFSDKVIETSTFRQYPQDMNTDIDEEADPSDDLLMTRENAFGTPEEDACRRDFTVNALFYNIADFSVIDYVGGLHDLEARILRSIGDPCIRFQEDPVRMIRAVRIAARIDFAICPDVLNAIQAYRHQILRCAPARNLEELLQLLRHNAAEASIRMLHSTGLMETILPEILPQWDNPEKAAAAGKILHFLDMAPRQSFPRTPSVMLAALFHHQILEATENLKSGEDLRQRVESVIEPFAKRFHLPRRYFDRITQLCIGQRGFQPKKHKRFRPQALLKRNFFPETLALASITLPLNDDLWLDQRNTWKSRILSADMDAEEKDAMLRILRMNPKGRKRRKRKPRNRNRDGAA
ncbi:polynucleotide adenylyltransferase PcnB [bacterium]|nr:polynucleotide adenylyltransferase PcnB [candidate division CSSED10-310 bacterium]